MRTIPHRATRSLAARLAPALALPGTVGCFVHVDRSPETETLSFHEPVEAVFVDVQSGDVEVRRGEVAQVERTWWGRRPSLDAHVAHGVLEVIASCDGLRSCRTEHVVYVPAGVDVDVFTGSGDVRVVDARSAGVSTGSGDVEARRIDGTLVVETGSGDVDVSDVGGGLTVLTGSGDVVAERLWSLQATIDTGSGDVRVQMVEVPASLTVETGSGDLVAELVGGRYDLRTRTRSGDVRVSGVTIDTHADSVVDLETGSGDIRVTGR